jgi:hypothetical protein
MSMINNNDTDPEQPELFPDGPLPSTDEGANSNVVDDVSATRESPPVFNGRQIERMDFPEPHFVVSDTLPSTAVISVGPNTTKRRTFECRFILPRFKTNERS